jgi:hypothetical protein
MAVFRTSDDDRSGGRGGWNAVFRVLALALASAVVSVTVTLLVRRYLARMGPAGALPAPTPIRRGAVPASGEAPPGEIEELGRALDERLEARETASAGSPLAAVAEGLSPARVGELEELLSDPDVVPGDGSDTCPAGFPIKGNGRSGIYHSPGAFAYGITHPTLCFRTVEAADRAGFRAAKR